MQGGRHEYIASREAARLIYGRSWGTSGRKGGSRECNGKKVKGRKNSEIQNV